MSHLIFRSSSGDWSVWSCACCDGTVRISDDQAADTTGPYRFYIAGHQPIGCDPDRVGSAYYFEAMETLESLELPAPLPPLVPYKKTQLQHCQHCNDPLILGSDGEELCAVCEKLWDEMLLAPLDDEWMDMPATEFDDEEITSPGRFSLPTDDPDDT